MNFACPKCKQATAISITTLKLDTFECYHGGEKLYTGALPKLAYKLSKEFHKLLINLMQKVKK